MRKRPNGGALVEFALLLPFLLLLTFITTEFGRALYQYDILTKSVRDAVRYLATQPPGTHITEARNLVVYGNPTGTGMPLAPNLSIANVAAPAWQTIGTNPPINTVSIAVTGYTFHALFPAVSGIPFGNIPFHTISATMRSPV